MSKKKPMAIAIGAVAVIALAGGGYFAYTKLQQQTDENTKSLESAGDVLVGDAYKTNSDDPDNEAMEPTIKKEELKPSRKVLRALQKENVNLSVEIIRLKEQIDNLKEEISTLEEYKTTNERFAPKRLKDEMADIERQVKAFLLDSVDAERFSVTQVEIMAAASALEYKAYIVRNRLMVTKEQRAQLASDFLPGYAFCVGDGIELAANNSKELVLIASKFRGDVTLALPASLQKDLDTVITPCQNTLRAQLDKNLEDNQK
jgi:hypothetical protein